MMKRLIVIQLAAAAAVLFSVSAYAETTDWLTGNQLKSEARRLGKSGQLATALNCKSGPNGAGAQTGGALFQIVYGPNLSNTKWQWNWGETGSYKRSSAKLTKQGFRRASTSSFVRQVSGLHIICSIWHKAD
jgi:hypothetical protein